MYDEGEVMERLYYRVPEIAEMLGISRASAYLLVKRGELNAVTIAGTVRVPVAALSAYTDELDLITSGS
jgi:excisionase family DNA binding protein